MAKPAALPSSVINKLMTKLKDVELSPSLGDGDAAVLASPEASGIPDTGRVPSASKSSSAATVVGVVKTPASTVGGGTPDATVMVVVEGTLGELVAEGRVVVVARD